MFDKLRQKIEDRDLQIAIENNEPVMANTIYFTTKSVKDPSWGENKYLIFYTDAKFIHPDIPRKHSLECMNIGKGSISYFTERNDITQTITHKYALKRLSKAHNFPYKRPDLSELNMMGLAFPINI